MNRNGEVNKYSSSCWLTIGHLRISINRYASIGLLITLLCASLAILQGCPWHRVSYVDVSPDQVPQEIIETSKSVLTDSNAAAWRHIKLDRDETPNKYSARIYIARDGQVLPASTSDALRGQRLVGLLKDEVPNAVREAANSIIKDDGVIFWARRFIADEVESDSYVATIDVFRDGRVRRND